MLIRKGVTTIDVLGLPGEMFRDRISGCKKFTALNLCVDRMQQWVLNCVIGFKTDSDIGLGLGLGLPLDQASHINRPRCD